MHVHIAFCGLTNHDMLGSKGKVIYLQFTSSGEKGACDHPEVRTSIITHMNLSY